MNEIVELIWRNGTTAASKTVPTDQQCVSEALFLFFFIPVTTLVLAGTDRGQLSVELHPRKVETNAPSRYSVGGQRPPALNESTANTSYTSRFSYRQKPRTFLEWTITRRSCREPKRNVLIRMHFSEITLCTPLKRNRDVGISGYTLVSLRIVKPSQSITPHWIIQRWMFQLKLESRRSLHIRRCFCWNREVKPMDHLRVD